MCAIELSAENLVLACPAAHRALAYVPRMLWSQPTADVTTYVAETTLPGSNDIGTSQISPERLSHRAALKSCRPIAIARARAKLTVYQPLAIERLSYEQRLVIRHWINPTIDCTLGSSRVLCHRIDTPAESLRTSDPRHSPPDFQFHVIYDIATTFKLRQRHFV